MPKTRGVEAVCGSTEGAVLESCAKVDQNPQAAQEAY